MLFRRDALLGGQGRDIVPPSGDAILLPLLFRFGAEKSRTISMIFFIVIFGGCMLLGKLAQQQGGLPRPPAWLANALPALLAILAVGTFVLSYWIAQGIYEKKEL